jgi:hypothetical protein
VEINKRDLVRHGKPEPGVIAMVAGGAAVAIPEDAVGGEAVVVRPISALDGRRSCNAQRNHRNNGWFEDALGPYERNPRALEVEATFKDGTGKGCVAGTSALLGKEFEGSEPNGCIALGIRIGRPTACRHAPLRGTSIAASRSMIVMTTDVSMSASPAAMAVC